MMNIDRHYVEGNLAEVVEAVRNGRIFIYPTDTIYGLGCNALLEESVRKLREIKRRETKPLSIIAPNKDWILENCELEIENLNKCLPGPYTLFLRQKEQAVAQGVNPEGKTLGVRLPKHWFTDIIAEAGVPFVTTSVNFSGEPHMATLEDVPEDISGQVDYCVYEGEKRGAPSTKIDLTLV